MKIIFLDIDGVLNCEDDYRAGHCQYVEWTWEDGRKDNHQRFCAWSK
jgi:histidinol phosphatase-like enzyme